MSNSDVARPVGWVEPTGRREAPPDDRLREIRERSTGRHVHPGCHFVPSGLRSKNERNKEAERRQTHCRQSRTSGCGRATDQIGLRRPVRCRARSPAGVPPRLLPRRVSHPQGATRARLRGTGRATGSARRHPPTSSDAPRTPVIVPAGMMPGPPGSGSQLRPRAPTSPRRPAMPAGRVLSGKV
jgi:hypothetical protein